MERERRSEDLDEMHPERARERVHAEVECSHEWSESAGAKYVMGEAALAEHMGDTPHWRLRISGRVRKGRARAALYFERYFAKVIVELYGASRDEPLSVAEWSPEADGGDDEGGLRAGSKRARGGHGECLELQRPRSDGVEAVTVHIYPRFHVPRFRLARPLALLVGLNTATRSVVYRRFWQYIAKCQLVDSDDPRKVYCNDELRDLFTLAAGADEETPAVIDVYNIPSLLAPFLLPYEPLTFSYALKEDENGSQSYALSFVYDSDMAAIDDDDDGDGGVPPWKVLHEQQAPELARLDEEMETLRAEWIGLMETHRDLKSFAERPSDYLVERVIDMVHDQNLAASPSLTSSLFPINPVSDTLGDSRFAHFYSAAPDLLAAAVNRLLAQQQSSN